MDLNGKIKDLHENVLFLCLWRRRQNIEVMFSEKK